MLNKKKNSIFLIDSETSKIILSSIINDKPINLKKHRLEVFEKQINQIKKDYNLIKKKINLKNFEYKNFIFWEIIKKKL